MTENSSNGELFSFENGNFSELQKELLKAFFRLVAKRYNISISAETVRYSETQIGLSPVRKIFTSSERFYPFFIKIGIDNEIQKESRQYGKARGRMPTLSMPPREAIISFRQVSDFVLEPEPEPEPESLIAFRSITGRTRQEAPRSLFSSYNKLSQYELIEIIDEIYQIALRDLHGFHEGIEYKDIEYVHHDIDLFSRNDFAITSSMVRKYNNLVDKSSGRMMPHGHVHGDLHCNNILLGRGNIPVIIDFAMLRETGCLLCDYAELEIAILVSALSDNFSETANSARKLYLGTGIFDHFGVDKFSRCVRVIRSNLMHSLYTLAQAKEIVPIKDVEFVYQMLVLRYLCSYSWVAHETMDEEAKHSTCALLSEIFNIVYSRVQKQNTNYNRRRTS